MNDFRLMCACVGALLAVVVMPASGGDLSSDLSLSTAALTSALPAQEMERTEVTTTETVVGRSHPDWVRELESKTWPGFLVGMDGFDEFIKPVGMPLYFEDPFIQSDVRFLYIYHRVPGGSVLRGGEVNVLAAQVRLALTERLAFVAWKDGYSWIDTGLTDGEGGWNDLGVGLKAALYADAADEFIVSGGLKWEWANGSRNVLQGRSQEITPFVSLAKGWDKWHFLGALSGRIPVEQDEASCSLVTNVHLDYALTETFRPLIELHSIYWLSGGGILAADDGMIQPFPQQRVHQSGCIPGQQNPAMTGPVTPPAKAKFKPGDVCRQRAAKPQGRIVDEVLTGNLNIRHRRIQSHIEMPLLWKHPPVPAVHPAEIKTHAAIIGRDPVYDSLNRKACPECRKSPGQQPDTAVDTIGTD